MRASLQSGIGKIVAPKGHGEPVPEAARQNAPLGWRGGEALDAFEEFLARHAVSAEEADEVGLGDVEEVGELAGLEGAGEPESAEGVEGRVIGGR
jgi:hypothetical protein